MPRVRAIVLALPVASGQHGAVSRHSPAVRAPLLGRPLFLWSLLALRQSGCVASCVLAAPSADVALLREAVAKTSAALNGVLTIVPAPGDLGASLRAATAALAPLAADPADWTLVHDARRPLLTPGAVRALVAARRAGSALICVEPAKETIKQVQDGLIRRTVPRESLARALTPQLYTLAHLHAILASDAATAILAEATDPALLARAALAAGVQLRSLSSAGEGLRVENMTDLAVAERLLAQRRS